MTVLSIPMTGKQERRKLIFVSHIASTVGLFARSIFCLPRRDWAGCDARDKRIAHQFGDLIYTPVLSTGCDMPSSCPKPWIQGDNIMKYIRERVLSGERMFGTWCNLGSHITAEIAGLSGVDWVLIDLEHGSGDYESLVHQLQALEGTPAAPIVRIAWNEPYRFKRILDLGASGIMVPWVNDGDEARMAAESMRYPPQGIRGVAKTNRATKFGAEFEDYFSRANDSLLTIAQIERVEGVKNAEEIAAVDGVDVLFIGPMDLTTGMGIQGQFDHPDFRKSLATVVKACRKHGKSAGYLLSSKDEMDERLAEGFTFIANGADGGMVAAGMKENGAFLAKYRKEF